jgi:transcriptional regulator with XRE-family HTH domain
LSTIERLEKLRLRRDLTWNDLSKELKVSRSMLHYLRKGKREPGARLLHRLKEMESAAGIASGAAVLREHFDAAARIADQVGGAEAKRQQMFNELATSPLLLQIAEIKTEIRSLLGRMDVFEEAIKQVLTDRKHKK